MKRTILLFVFTSFIGTALKAQQWAETGTRWYYDMSGDGTAPPRNTQFNWYVSTGDTIHDGQPCKLIRRYSYRWNTCDTVELSPLFTFSRNDTVYISRHNGTFYTMYIFSAGVGDTLTLGESKQKYVLKVIGTSIIMGRMYSDFILDRDSYTEPYGSTFLLETFESEWNIPESPGPLRCFSNSIGLHNFNPAVACDSGQCRTLSLEDGIKEPIFRLYPNPAKDEFTIVCSSPNEAVHINIWNASGVQVYTYDKAAGEREIMVTATNWPAGMYFISLTDKTGNRTFGKVMLHK